MKIVWLSISALITLAIGVVLYHCYFYIFDTSTITKKLKLRSNKIIFNEVFFLLDRGEEFDKRPYLGKPGENGLSMNYEIAKKEPNSAFHVLGKISIGDTATIIKAERRDSAWAGIFDSLIFEMTSGENKGEKIKTSLDDFFTLTGGGYVKTNAISYQP